jgi:medium-chain acyl-[acyl-carrier-protein] hydrolase
MNIADNQRLKEFGTHGTIAWHEADLNNRLRPHSFMNIIQELANEHASKLKFGYKELMALDQVWVLSRFRAKFRKYPKWRDKIFTETWHKGKQGLFGLRDFALFIEEGNEQYSSSKVSEAAIAATSSWLIINTKTRHIERNNAFNASEEANSMANMVDAINEPCEKLHAPDNLVKYGEHIVCYSDLDFNRHANNAKYVEWIMDSIDVEILQHLTLKEFQINFITEARAGDKVELFNNAHVKIETGNIENGHSIYFEGRKEESIIFEAELVF